MRVPSPEALLREHRARVPAVCHKQRALGGIRSPFLAPSMRTGERQIPTTCSTNQGARKRNFASLLAPRASRRSGPRTACPDWDQIACFSSSDLYRRSPEIPGQNLALALLYVPCSLDSGGRWQQPENEGEKMQQTANQHRRDKGPAYLLNMNSAGCNDK